MYATERSNESENASLYYDSVIIDYRLNVNAFKPVSYTHLTLPTKRIV